MSISIIIGADMPPGATSIDRAALAAFVTANFTPAVDAEDVIVSVMVGRVTAELGLSREPNERELSHLMEAFLSNDLVTIADAAAACNVGIKRISAAVSVGALRGYTNPAAPNPRKGGTLVSLAECRQKWGG